MRWRDLLMLNLMNRFVRTTCWLILFYCLIIVLLLGWPLTGWLLALFVWLGWKHCRRQRPTDLGSAKWADASDLNHSGMLGAQSGLILGRLPRASRRGRGKVHPHDPFVRLPQALHTTIFGPTGSGKGVSFVIPSLMTNPDSMVVLDFKGELARATAEHRRKQFEHRVVLLDPYHSVTDKPDTFCPLDFIPKGHPLAIDDCNDLAAALVVRTGQERERHWDDSAEACIAAVAATVVAYGEPHTRSLQTVRELLSHPKSFELAVRLMTESDAWDRALAKLGGQLLHFDGKEKTSVLSSTLRHLRFLGSPVVAASTAASTFDPADLRRGKMTVFCILPPERAHAQSGLLRMWVSSMLRACIRGGLQ